MKLSIMKLKEDMLGENAYRFYEEFPSSKIKILDLQKRPNCSICIRAAILAVLKPDDHIERLNKIYGIDVELGPDIVTLKEKSVLEFKTVDVLRVPIGEWENTAIDYVKKHGSRISYMATAYDPTKEEIIATVFFHVGNHHSIPPVPVNDDVPKKRKSTPAGKTPVGGGIRSGTIDAKPRNPIPNPVVVPPMSQSKETGSGPSILDDPNIQARLDK